MTYHGHLLTRFPQSKRRRFNGSDIRRLLHLPDDALRYLLRHLCGLGPGIPGESGPLLRGSGLERASDAFALAQTCTRLMRLFFESCLTRIDVTSGPREALPSTYEDKININRLQMPSHMRAMVFCAGANLRELRLPMSSYFHVFFLESVILEVAIHCPRLHKLSFFEPPSISSSVLEILIARVGASLRTLIIVSSQLLTLRCLKDNSQCRLRKVELQFVDPSKIDVLVDFIQERGECIEEFQVVFNPPPSVGNAHAQGGVQNLLFVRNFTGFLRTQLLICCPKLHTFDIGVRRNLRECSCASGQHLFNCQLAEDEVSEVCKFLLQQAPYYGEEEPRLRILRVRTGNDEDSIVDHFRDLLSLIGASTRVELILPFVTVVLPMPGSDRIKPFYSALLLKEQSYVTKALEKNESVFDKVEHLTVNVDNVMRQGLAPLQILYRRTGVNLKSIHAIKRMLMDQASVRNLSEVMGLATSVTILYVSRELICFSRGYPHLFGPILANLRIITLLNEEKYSPAPSTVINAALVGALPDFLLLVKDECPFLEAMYLHQVDNVIAEGFQCELEQLLHAVRALMKFEIKRPKVDVLTVKGQLVRWMSTCRCLEVECST